LWRRKYERVPALSGITVGNLKISGSQVIIINKVQKNMLASSEQSLIEALVWYLYRLFFLA
jgi:hypothetical protein